MNSLTRITLGRLQAPAVQTGTAQYIPVSGVDVSFHNGRLSAGLSSEATSVSVMDSGVSVGLKGEVLLSNIKPQELSAMFGGQEIRVEVNG